MRREGIMLCKLGVCYDARMHHEAHRGFAPASFHQVHALVLIPITTADSEREELFMTQTAIINDRDI